MIQRPFPPLLFVEVFDSLVCCFCLQIPAAAAAAPVEEQLVSVKEGMLLSSSRAFFIIYYLSLLSIYGMSSLQL